ncbi:MAG: hypothetical protein ABEJ73_12455 [Haloplanus sp.]
MSDGRFVVATLVVVGLLAAGATPPVATAETPGEWRSVATAEMSASQTEASSTIHQRGIVSRNAEPGSVTLTFEYRIPSSIRGLRVSVPVVSLPGITVESTEGFERTTPTRFLWDGETERPRVTFRLAVSDAIDGGVRGVERGDWALVSEPNTRVQVRSDGRPVQTDSFEVATGEEGYADSHLAYLGPHERRNVTVADERATFVLGADDADPARAVDFLRTANEQFDLGIQREAITVFVLPLGPQETENIEAATVDTAFWVGERGLRFNGTGAVFAHEYVHTRLNTVGRGDAAWLTEASAEYYGRLFAFNDGIGTDESFREGLRASEYAPDRQSVVLADAKTWRGTKAHYTKGAHVLAALDAQIQRRTDGERTLRDVFEGRSRPFRNYRAFRTAVIRVAGDESIGPWLDRYVTTDALPPLPEHPRYYVAAPSLDPDGDGMASGTELDRRRHPFVAGADARITGTPSATTATPTPVAETEGGSTPDTTGGTDGTSPGFGPGLVAAAMLVFLLGARLRES